VGAREEEQEAEDRGEHEQQRSETFIRTPNTTNSQPFPRTTVVTLPAAFHEIIDTIVQFIVKLCQIFTQWWNTISLQIDADYQLNFGRRRISGRLQFGISYPQPASHSSGDTPPIRPLTAQALATLNHQPEEESTATIPIRLHPTTPLLRRRDLGRLPTINENITPSEWARIEDHRAGFVSPPHSEHEYPEVEPDTTPSWYNHTGSNIGSRH